MKEWRGNERCLFVHHFNRSSTDLIAQNEPKYKHIFAEAIEIFKVNSKNLRITRLSSGSTKNFRFCCDLNVINFGLIGILHNLTKKLMQSHSM